MYDYEGLVDYLEVEDHTVVTASRSVEETITWLKDEAVLANNIKSDVHRKRILLGLSSIIQKVAHGIPKRGLILYAHAGELDEYRPRSRLFRFLYNCGNEFIEYSDNVTQPTAMFSVDNREAAVVILRGTAIDYIDETSSGVAGKHDAGGQSQRRFERNRIAELKKYYKRIATDARRLVEFRPIELFMSGPADAKVKV